MGHTANVLCAQVHRGFKSLRFRTGGSPGGCRMFLRRGTTSTQSTEYAPVAQRIEHLTTDQKVGGSNPSRRTRLETCFMVTGFGLIVDLGNTQPSHAKIAQFAAVAHSWRPFEGRLAHDEVDQQGYVDRQVALRGHVLRTERGRRLAGRSRYSSAIALRRNSFSPVYRADNQTLSAKQARGSTGPSGACGPTSRPKVT